MLTSISPETKDADFTWKDYQSKVNSELVCDTRELCKPGDGAYVGNILTVKCPQHMNCLQQTIAERRFWINTIRRIPTWILPLRIWLLHWMISGSARRSFIWWTCAASAINFWLTPSPWKLAKRRHGGCWQYPELCVNGCWQHSDCVRAIPAGHS